MSPSSCMMIGSYRCNDLKLIASCPDECRTRASRALGACAKDQVQGQGRADVDPEVPKDRSSLTQRHYCIIGLGLARRAGPWQMWTQVTAFLSLPACRSAILLFSKGARTSEIFQKSCEKFNTICFVNTGFTDVDNSSAKFDLVKNGERYTTESIVIVI